MELRQISVRQKSKASKTNRTWRSKHKTEYEYLAHARKKGSPPDRKADIETMDKIKVRS